MKLQKQLSRKVNSKEYSKYVITLPPKAVKKVGWKDGAEIDFEITSKGLLLKKK